MSGIRCPLCQRQIAPEWVVELWLKNGQPDRFSPNNVVLLHQKTDCPVKFPEKWTTQELHELRELGRLHR